MSPNELQHRADLGTLGLLRVFFFMAAFGLAAQQSSQMAAPAEHGTLRPVNVVGC